MLVAEQISIPWHNTGRCAVSQASPVISSADFLLYPFVQPSTPHFFGDSRISLYFTPPVP
jgi:hypothetical protein